MESLDGYHIRTESGGRVFIYGPGDLGCRDLYASGTVDLLGDYMNHDIKTYYTNNRELAEAMSAPIRRNLNYAGVARRLIDIQLLDVKSIPYYTEPDLGDELELGQEDFNWEE